jgi:hypothetical protein
MATRGRKNVAAHVVFAPEKQAAIEINRRHFRHAMRSRLRWSIQNRWNTEPSN